MALRYHVMFLLEDLSGVVGLLLDSRGAVDFILMLEGELFLLCQFDFFKVNRAVLQLVGTDDQLVVVEFFLQILDLVILLPDLLDHQLAIPDTFLLIPDKLGYPDLLLFHLPQQQLKLLLDSRFLLLNA